MRWTAISFATPRKRRFESLYQGHPDITGVWAANGGTATGVMAALKTRGKVPGKDVIVVGMDLNPENVQAVKSGALLFDIGGHWLQGGFALVLLYDYLKGIPVPASDASVKLKLLPLTQDRVAQFEKDFRTEYRATTSSSIRSSTTRTRRPRSSR